MPPLSLILSLCASPTHGEQRNTTAFFIGSHLALLAQRRGQLSRQIEHKGTGAFTPAHSFHSPAPTPFPVSIQPHSPWLRSQATSHRNAGHKLKRGASCSDTHHVNGGTQKVGNIPE